ncbi:MAG: hypothetical protein WAQ05_16395 [Rubrivivax sp.]
MSPPVDKLKKREPGDPVEHYPGLSRRRKLLLALLAVVTAVTVVLTLLNPPGGVQRVRKLPADAAACSGVQTRDCVGGVVEVIVPAAASAASAR